MKTLREGDNPLFDLISFLLPVEKIPRNIREDLFEENIDAFFTKIKKWNEKDKHANSSICLAIIQDHLGYEKESQNTILKALETDKNNPSLRLLALDLVLEKEGFDEVKKELLALEKMKLSAGQFTVLGEYWLDCENENKAIQCLNTANLNGGTISAARTLATLYAGKGELENAARSLEFSGSLAPKDKELWLAIGEVWLSAENWIHAENAFRYCEDIKAPIEEADWGLCRSLLPQGKWEHSLRLLRRLQEWNPDHSDYVLMEIDLLLEHNPSKGEKRLRDIIKKGTQIPELYILLAEISEEYGELDQAKKSIRKGIEQLGGLPVLILEKSKIERKYSNFAVSLELAKQAIEGHEDTLENEEYRFNLVAAYLPLDSDKALEIFESQAWDAEREIEFLEQLALNQAWEIYDHRRFIFGDELNSETQPIIEALDLLRKISAGQHIETPVFLPFVWDLAVIQRIHARLGAAKQNQFGPILDALFDVI